MAKKKTAASKTSNDEQVGFHKGSLATLAKEREELGRMLQIVEQLMHMHVKALNELGVDLKEEVKKQKPLEDSVK